ncbi:MAG: SDR family NAD(P)-dependent oxidoreductase [Burkholderiales bacterium]
MADARKKAIVTGAASGIGAATMVELARRGFDVACLDINAAGGRASVEAAAREGGRHAFVEVEVADEPGLVRAFGDAVGQLGGLDALVTAAGVGDMVPFMELDAATFRRVHDVNVVGTFLCMREAAKVMPRGGRICTVASVAGLRGGGLSGTAAYAASKGGVLALTKNAARALAERGISVNTIAPGATMTPMIAEPWKNPAHRARVEAMAVQNRTGEPREIAQAIAFLLSAEASFITGSTLVADGGLVMY